MQTWGIEGIILALIGLGVLLAFFLWGLLRLALWAKKRPKGAYFLLAIIPLIATQPILPPPKPARDKGAEERRLGEDDPPEGK